MRRTTAAVAVGAGLLAAAWIGGTAATAGNSGWWVEPEMGTALDYAAPRAAEFRPAGAVEVGGLPSGEGTVIWVEEGIGSSYDSLAGKAD